MRRNAQQQVLLRFEQGRLRTSGQKVGFLQTTERFEAPERLRQVRP